MLKKLFLASFCSVLCLACSKSPTKIQAASYVQVNSYYTKTDTTQGTNNQKFTDILVLSKTDNLGYFPLGSPIPLAITGGTELKFRPVINVNGLAALKIDYPMMRSCDTTFCLVPGKLITVQPTFEYYPTVNFRFMENFESNPKMINDNPVDTFGVKIDTTTAQKYYGSKTSMLIRMDALHNTPVEARSFQGFVLPSNGSSVFLEFNYMSNVSIAVRVAASNSPNYNPNTYYSNVRDCGGANPSASWNKFYVDLSQVVSKPPFNTPSYFFLDFYCQYEVQPYSYARIDNIKVISLQ